MKIAFDVDVLAKQMDINRMVHQVADWGYKYIEQSLCPCTEVFVVQAELDSHCKIIILQRGQAASSRA